MDFFVFFCLGRLYQTKKRVYFKVRLNCHVQVSVWKGMSLQNKKRLVEGITGVFDGLGVPKEAVEIVIYETPKSNWATGEKLHSEKLADVRPL